MNSTEQVMEDIECPVCFELMVPPILQCEHGHGTCSICLPKLDNCPLCKGKLTSLRKTEAEALSYSIQHPCKFHAFGCNEKYYLEGDQKEKHESQCLYMCHKCPLGDELCNAAVDPNDAKDHIFKVHKERIREASLNKTQLFTRCRHSYNVNAEAWVVGDDMFIAYSKSWAEYSERCFRNDWNVYFTYVGSIQEARKYMYKVTVRSQKKFRLSSYTSLCTSYLETPPEDINGLHPDVLIKECVDAEGNITYEFEISKIG